MEYRGNQAGQTSGPGSKKKADADRVWHTVEISHPDKVLYQESGITKGDVAAYYAEVSRRMLPYVENRVLSVVRCPQGKDKACFFQKHPKSGVRGVIPIVVPVSGGTEAYYSITDASGLMAEVQRNTLEFHTWGSRVQTLEKPDVMVFDLDPDEGMDVENIRQGVKDLKSLLDRLSHFTYLKTSGGKGYHVVIPFRPAAGWDAFHDFARRIATDMESGWPDRYTSVSRKESRKNRIFIDWLRNARGASSVAPYSLRARSGAPVSMPIFWEELDTVSPNGITLEDALARLRREDPWAGFFEHAQPLDFRP